jgi:hypothetical protein
MHSVAQPVRGLLQAEGMAVFILSLFLYWHSGASWWLFAAFLLTPDLAMLPYLINPRAGAAAYNLAHNYVLPLIVAAILLGSHSNRFLAFLLIWTAHIGMDRMMGYGLKYPSGFKQTHLSSPAA